MDVQIPPEWDTFTHQYLTSAARRLEETIPCTPCGQEDYLQDLSLNLWQRRLRFDPAKARWTTFVRLVTDHRAIELRHRCLHGRCAAARMQIVQHDEFWDTSSSPFSETNTLALDVRNWVSSLDPDEQRICRTLMLYSVSEAARIHDMPDSTLRDSVKRIRRRYEHGSLSEYLPWPRKGP